MPRILAIDDVLDNLITIESVLNSYLPNCQVSTALSGQKGIEMAVEGKPDLILLDILMPEMDGFEVSEVLKSKAETNQIPIIMVSALGSISESRAKGLDAGADAFVAKPIDPAELVAQVKVMLRIKEVEDTLRNERNNLEKLVELRSEKLLESEKRYKSIIEDQTQAIIRYKEEGILTFVNDSYCSMQKRKREDLLGLSFFTLVAADDISRVRAKIEGLTIDNPVVVDEHRTILPGGTISWQQWTDRALYNGKGELIEYQAEGVDITARKQAEEDLRESEEKFRQLAENIGQVFWLASPDMEHMFYISPAYEEIWGQSCQSLLDNPISWFDVIFEEEKREVRKVLDSPLGETGELRFPEFRIKKPDGSTRWIQANAYPIHDNKGNLVRMAGLAKDITQKKKLEEATKQVSGGIESVTGNVFFESLVKSLVEVLDVEFAFVGKYVKTSSKTIQTLVVNKNGEAQDNFECTIEGSACENVVKGELSIYKENVQDIFPSDSLLNYHGANSYAGVPLFSSSGALLGIIVVMDKKPFIETEMVKTVLQMFSGRTGAELERLHTEKALVESEEKFRTIVEASPDAVLRTDLNHIIIYASSRAAEIFGFESYKDLIGKHFNELVTEESKSKVEGTFQKVLEEGTVRDEECVFFGKEKSTYFGEFSSSAIKNNSGEPLGFIIITKDITVRKDAENAIKVYQENLRSMTSELNLAVEKERRRIAVDLHDHLGQSLAMARIKLSGMKNEPLPEKTIEDIVETEKYVIDAIKNSRTLTYELSPPVLFELGLAAAINWKLEQLNSKYQLETNLEVEDEVPELNEDLLILMFRAVGELLNNIVKHANATTVSVRMNFKGKFLNISVSDNGKGFETKGVDTKFNKKAGIGLFSIRERLEYFDGKMYIDSALEKGSRVYLSVPVN